MASKPPQNDMAKVGDIMRRRAHLDPFPEGQRPLGEQDEAIRNPCPRDIGDDMAWRTWIDRELALMGRKT